MPASMRSVELVESDEPDQPDAAASDPVPSWVRRHAWWGAAGAALLAAGLVAAQVRADAVDRSRIETLSLVPGVLHPLDGTLDVAWRLDTQHAGAVWNGPADGVIVSGARRATTTFALQGTDVETGRELWSTAVRPNPGPAAWTWCLPVGHGSSEVLVCTAGSNSGLWDVTAPDRVLWVVQPRTGRLLAQHEVPIAAQVAAQGDHLLLASPLDDSRWRLEAVDPVTRTAAWTFTTDPVDGVSTRLLSAPQLATMDGGVLLSVPDHVWSISAGGRLRASIAVDVPTWWTGLRAGVALGVPEQDDAPYASALLLADGSRVDSTDAELPVAPDDGTAPDTFFTVDHADHGALVARSATDGSVRWRADVAPTTAILVDGRLVMGARDTVIAFDARTGRELWRRDQDAPVAQISTDGRSVAVTHESSTVEAIALPDGTPDWSTDVRDTVGADVGSVGFYGSTRYLLVALASGGVVALR